MFFVKKIESQTHKVVTHNTLFCIMRKGSIVVVNDASSHGTFQRVAKILEIVDRESERIAVVKLHRNGQIYIIPMKHLDKATPLQKRGDPRNYAYWPQQPYINLSKVFWVSCATSAPQW